MKKKNNNNHIRRQGRSCRRHNQGDRKQRKRRAEKDARRGSKRRHFLTVGVVVAVVAPRNVHHLVGHADVLRVGPKVFRRRHGHELDRPLVAERLVRLQHRHKDKRSRPRLEGGGVRLDEKLVLPVGRSAIELRTRLHLR